MTDNENVFTKSGIVDLFAGLPVKKYDEALNWYEKLLGCPPTFVAGETEAVWQLQEHRSLFIEKHEAKAGGALHSIFIDQFDLFVSEAAKRGIEPSRREEYSNGVRKAIYIDPDGNEIGFGGAPSA